MWCQVLTNTTYEPAVAQDKRDRHGVEPQCTSDSEHGDGKFICLRAWRHLRKEFFVCAECGSIPET